MLEFLVAVLFYVIPYIVFVRQAIHYDLNHLGHVSVGSFIIYLLMGAIPFFNIICMFAVMTDNKVFSKKLFTRK